MTQVRIRIGPTCPFVTIRPIRRYIDAEGVWLAQPVTLLLENGTLTTDLDPTTGAIGAYVVEEHGGITRCIEVPDSVDILDYESLRDLDPSSFAALDQVTGADALAEWLAVVTGMKNDADTAAINAQTAAVDALISLDAVVTAEQNTLSAATTAETAATQAETARLAAVSARTLAETAELAAQTARDAALDAQVLAQTAAATATAPATEMVDAAITAQDIGGQVAAGVAGRVPSRANTYHDPSTKANGPISSATVLDSGQNVINNVGSHPVSYAGGRIVHTPTGVGSPTAGYLAVKVPTGVVRRMSAYVAWPANALGAATFVIPSAFWDINAGLLPVAGVHVAFYGNGVWTCGTWNPSAAAVGHISEILDPGAATAVTLTVTNGSGTQSTASLPVATLTAEALQTALIALSNVGAGKATVIKNLGGALGITWSTSLTATTMAVTAQTGTGATIIEVSVGAPTYADYLSNGRYATVWDNQLRLIDVWLYPETNQIIIYFPDGSNSGVITHPGIGLLCASGYAVYELFENNTGVSDTPASLGKLWVDNAQIQQDALLPTKPDVVALVNAGQRTVNEYSSAGSYSGPIPSGTKGVLVTIIGSGSGGGSGRRGAAGAIRCGGSAGGSGGVLYDVFIPVAALGSSYGVTIGAAGVGGAAVTANDTSGNPGVSAGAISFSSGSAYLRVTGTSGGGGGGATPGTAGNPGLPLGSLGQAANAAGAAGTNGAATYTGGTGAAGAGGGISVADAPFNGGAGSTSGIWAAVATVAGGITGGALPAQGAALLAGRPGDGPGGGASSVTAAAQAGGTALGYGAGGGGGGASANGFNSGAGGNGGPGYVRVTIVRA